MEAKKKVLLITDYFYPHWTGISKAILNMTQMLKDRIDFTVLTVRFDPKLKSFEVIQDIPVIREDYLFSLSRAKYSSRIIGRAFFEIPKHDVVLVNSPNSNILPFSLITKFYGKKLCTFHQGDLTLPGGFKDRIIERIFDYSTLGAFQLADKVSTYTRDYAEHSRVLKPNLHKFTPLLMPFLLEEPGIPKDSRLHDMLKKKSEGYVIFGSAGRFVEEKGFDILFRAIPQMKSTHKFLFAFAGETHMSYENTFEKLQALLEPIQDKLMILGLLDSSELAAFYKNIDYIVTPSRSDCFPLVQAEACLSGVPSICADIPGARVLVQKTGFGELFTKENPEDLAKVLDKVLQSDNRFKKEYKNVLQMLDNNANAEAIAAYLEQ